MIHDAIEHVRIVARSLARAGEDAPPVEALQICGEASEKSDACLQRLALLFVPRERTTIHGALLFSWGAFKGHLSAPWTRPWIYICNFAYTHIHTHARFRFL